MSKFKLFIENFFIYGIGGVISRIVPLVMVPIIVKLMPDSTYYGISDLSNTLIQLGVSLATFGMYDAMYRMFFEKEDTEYKKIVCSTTLWFTVISSIVVFILVIAFNHDISRLFLGEDGYFIVIFLSALAIISGATNNIVSAPTRMQNKRKIYLIANTIGPILSYGIAIPLLLNGYYLIALPLATFISGFSVEICFLYLNRKWFNKQKYDKKLLVQLLKIALPLVPNMLIYWIFSSCDKIMITNILGVGDAGIYSVSSKLGHCSQIIYMAFAGGWQFFAFSTMNEENQVKNNSNVFEYLETISFAISTLVCAMSYAIFNNFFSEDYLMGYIAAPYLFIAPLIQMLFQVISNQFLVVKKTWPSMIILIIGGMLNIVLNILLIPILGIEGASIATLMGYLFTVIICMVVLMKMKLFVLTKRIIIVFCVMFTYFLVWRFCSPSNTIFNFCLAICVCSIYIFLYKKEIIKMRTMLKNKGTREEKN